MSARLACLSLIASCALIASVPAGSATSAPPPPAPTNSYADLADLADSAPLVARVQVKKIAQVEPARAAGLRPGWARLYIEAQTEALLAGNVPVGSALRYLADVPLDARGKLPQLKKRRALIFARAVPGRPGELQLIASDAQLLWDAPLEARLRSVLTELLAADAPGRITGVREVIYVAGTLAGEGETQMFLNTASGEAAAISVVHRPDRPDSWGISFSEVLNDNAAAPPHDSLAWYRLACFLPPQLPPRANVSETAADRQQAAADYRMVLGQLGPCGRTRG